MARKVNLKVYKRIISRRHLYEFSVYVLKPKPIQIMYSMHCKYKQTQLTPLLVSHQNNYYTCISVVALVPDFPLDKRPDLVIAKAPDLLTEEAPVPQGYLQTPVVR